MKSVGYSVGSSLHRARVDPVVVFMLLQRSGLGHSDVRNSLKPLNAEIWQCYIKISVSVTDRPALLGQPLIVENGLWICLF